ncbi:MAG: hypothetical protein QOD77_514 [Thermoplasmata archaeon]|nr:hypothetical protein [Thermoplasmata archaeon]
MHPRKLLLLAAVAVFVGASVAPAANAWSGLDAPSPSKYAGVDSVGTSLPWDDYTNLVDPNPGLDSDGVVTRSTYYLVCEFMVDLGFDFTYYGKTYRKAAVSPWGYIRPVPDTATATFCYNYYPYSKLGTASPPGAIAGLWTYYAYYYSGGTITAGTVGAPGEREFAVQYDKMREGTSLQFATFEIRLYEADNHIEVRIRDATVGVEYPSYTYSYYTAQGIQDGVYGVTGVTRGLDKQYSGYCSWSSWMGGTPLKCKRVFDDVRTIYMPAPQLDFKVEPKPPCPGEDATFTAKYQSPIGPPRKVTWSFGEEGETAMHRFLDGPAETEVKMTAEFDYGFTMDWAKNVHVNGCKPPVAVFRADVFGTEGAVSDESYDVDGRVKTWTWDWGDGTPKVLGRVPPAHPYTAEGSYEVRLTVTDNEGLSGTSTQVVRVKAAAGYIGPKPVADAGPDQTVRNGDRVQLDGSGADANRAVRVTWTQLSGPLVDLEAADTARPSFVPAAIAENAPQVYGFALQIFDGFRTSDPDLVVVTVEPRVPVPTADAGVDLLVPPGLRVGLDASGSKDAFGNPLTYAWRQVDGPKVELQDADQVAPSFDAPKATEPVELVFEVVAANSEERSLPDTVKVVVQPPVEANVQGFTHRPDYASGLNVVQFQATVKALDEATFEWDFGDGTAPRTGPLVEHAYQEAGAYPVTLRVKGAGLEQVFQDNVEVAHAEAPATPALGAPAEAQPSPGVAPLAVLALLALAAFAARRR